MIKFDEQQLNVEIERLPVHLRVAFAAACAERLMPAYVNFSSAQSVESAKLASILQRLWRDIEGEEMSNAQVQESLDTCMSLIPKEGDVTWLPGQGLAEDAAAALAYALRCRINGEAKEAVWAARRAYEALDHFVVNRGNIDTNALDGESRVLSHHLVQAELGRQRRDLEYLFAVRTADAFKQIGDLKHRAMQEAGTVFSLAS
jgi:uncharacterized protein YjaG (DUF416 family)